MLRKATITAATLAVAATTAVAPAMAAETPAGFDRPASDQQPVYPSTEGIKTDVKPLLPGKTYDEQVQQAELTGKRIDNAKKGVETAKGIVDTLGGLGGLFGFGGGK